MKYQGLWIVVEVYVGCVKSTGKCGVHELEEPPFVYKIVCEIMVSFPLSHQENVLRFNIVQNIDLLEGSPIALVWQIKKHFIVITDLRLGGLAVENI